MAELETEATIERKIMRALYQMAKDLPSDPTKKIIAIKAFRSVTGKGLKESKDLYENVEKTYQTEDWISLLKARGVMIRVSVAGAIYLGPDDVAIGHLDTPLAELKSMFRGFFAVGGM